jgi:DNA-binding CsgD family transcriptional regulator
MEPGAATGLLFGRESELARIDRFLERPSTDGAALVLEGEPGIGKSSLWLAGVEAALGRGLAVLSARPAEAERDLSFSALGDLLEPALGRLEALSPPRRSALEVALLLASDRDGAPDARAVGLAARDLLRLLADEQPLLIALDDTQWLDPPTRETLAYALRRLEHEPITLLGACRPGDGAPPLVGAGRIVVGPLSLGAIQQVVRDRTGAPLSRPTLVRVHETSGGNPFFALELVRALDGRDLRPGDPLPVSATLSDLTASRFERLDADTREVLRFVAALARPTREVVTAAAGRHTAGALETAVAVGVIEADASRLRFTHPLLASVQYASASADERRRIHRRLAEVVTDVEERGRHLGAAASAPDAEVAAALDRAAAAARARGAPVTAAELAEVALARTPADDAAARVRRRCAAADHHFAAGSTARARALLEEALTGATPGRERARVALELARLLDSKDLLPERPLLEQALLDADGDTALQARVHEQLAVHFDGLDYRESRKHAHVALELAERSGEPQLIAETLAWASDRDFWTGAGIDEELVNRGLALEDQLPRLPLTSRPSTSYAWALKWSGDLERAAPLWERLRTLGRSTGDLDVIHILFFSTYHELMAENWDQAARFADEAWELAVEAERDVEVAQCRRARATVDAYRGHVEPTRSTAEEAFRLGAAAGFSEQSLSGLSLGILELSLGEAASALSRLRPVTQRKLSRGVEEPGLMLGFPEHVEAAVACGELEEAMELLDVVEAHARRLDRAWALGCCARGRALLATARGDVAAAEAAFTLAYEQHARRPQQLPTYELARTSLAHGAILRRRQRKRQAREALERAHAIFGGLGAQVYAERARSELARIGGRAVAAGDELSETERRIADLVAEGRSNKEVAAVLALSPKTVEWNLSKVYAKLGVRSRTELASRRR